MRSFTVDERRNRLARRHFVGADTAQPITAITASLVGLHATDPATPYLSLWARHAGFTTRELDEELYRRRSLVKHLAMRRTLWVVCADHLPSIQSAASDRVAHNERRRLIADVQKAGVAADGAAWLDRACAAVVKHLDEHGAASSAELRAALPELAGTMDYAPGKSWGGQTPLAPRVLTVLSVRGDIIRGPNDGGWTASRPRWTPTGQWLGGAPHPVAPQPMAPHPVAPQPMAPQPVAPQPMAAQPVAPHPVAPQPVPPQTARAELLRRWLWTFGPATLADVKWWFGTTVTTARQALNDVGAAVVDVHGTAGYALPDDLAPEPEPEPWAALLPALDVTAMGWFDRAWYLGEHRKQVFDRNGNAGPTAWWNGRVVGGWCQSADGRVQVQLLEDPGRQAQRALRRRADQLTEWLGGTRISPRFPSPLSKAPL